MTLAAEAPAKGVFLSYSSRDREIAIKLKTGLERLGVAVRLDVEAMQPGQGIRAFILESIRTTVATVFIVSEASLVSDWVAIEVSTSLVDGDLWNKRAFVAGYLDDCFFDPKFRLRATETIDARIKQIDELLPAYITKNLNPIELNNDKTRLHQLRSDLGNLLDRLKNTLCVDLRGDLFDATLQRLASTLRPLAPSAAMASLSAASNIDQRRDEIYEMVANGDGDRALKRIMDFVRDFSEDKGSLREITLTTGNYRRLETVQGRSLKEVRDERTEILGQALTLLDATIDALTRKAA